MNELILIVDDEPKIAKLAKDYLENSGFKVLVCGNGLDALSIFRQQKPDLMVLDLMLPGMDGLDVCRTIRREAAIPIIMLTARSEEIDRLIGLELGADDYIVKPFSPKELVARVRAVMRRINGDVKLSDVLRIGELEIDLKGYRVLKNNQPVMLTRHQFDILAEMAGNAGQVFTREQLVSRLHGYSFTGIDRSIDAHVKNLRQRLEDDPANPRYILTVYGVGYKFNEGLKHDQI